MVSKKSLIITGPTASGKTSLALSLATDPKYQNSIEIINADSLLIYREMNIGTAKPTQAELERVPHHLVDIRDPSEDFTAGDFVRLAHHAIQEIQSRGKRALIIGGTGFYLKALVKGIWNAPPTDAALRERLEKEDNSTLFARLEISDPKTARRIGQNDRYRLIRSLEIIELSGTTPSALEESHQSQATQSAHTEYPVKLMIIDRSEGLSERIKLRSRQMLEMGLIEEVNMLRSKYPKARSLSSVGYQQVCDYLDGTKPEGRKMKEGLPGLEEEIILATNQLVKKQRTFFKGQFKDQAQWFYLDQDLEKLKQEFDNWVQEKD